MDPMMIEKLQAMKRCRRKNQLFPSFIKYFVAALLVGLFLSSPLWLSSIKPATASGTMSLFIVCNTIIFFLVSESKRSKPTSGTWDGIPIQLDRELGETPISDKMEGTSEGEERQEEGGEGEDEGLALNEEEKGVDELNKRVEDFIAKVKRGRRFEARKLVSYDYYKISRGVK